ncbi:MAG: diguanylate cyclase [Phycisphaerales bacterium]|jgi:two-component system, cell cycle response regulator|nr:diguanylate cyclase [Phycisphaerales bacterium]
MKIVIIDDSPDALALAKARLTKECDDIFCANCGKDGLKMVREEIPDLILLDVDMPDISGFDICRTLKNDDDLHTIPIIFLSGTCGQQDKVKGLDIGAVDFVTKPFDAFELRARVRVALRTKHLHDLLSLHAQLDPLTELFNRRAMSERLEREWARAERHDKVISFAMLDLDHFKKINDTFGHSVGDRVLQNVAKTLISQCRKIDLPVRYGGEEFAIVIPDEAAEQAAKMVERLRDHIANTPLITGDTSVTITASFGVADSTDRPSIKAMIEAADMAMYQAKQNGRNRVEAALHLEPVAKN